MAERSGEGAGDRGCSPLLVSACLLGVRCNHEGEANTSEAVVALGERFRLVPVCPETAGGLPTPRSPAERRADGSVRSAAGDDVTGAYRRGADHAVRLAGALGAVGAVLKARSPSCGCHEIYRSGRRAPGEGVTAEALRAAGLPIADEDDVAHGVAWLAPPPGASPGCPDKP